MPFKIIAEHDKQLTKFTVIGEPSLQEGLVSYKNYYEDNPSVNVLWDFKEANLARISSKQIREAINSIIPYTEKRAGGKTAFVVSKGLDYKKSKMIQEFFKIKRIPIKVKVFKTTEEAIEWLYEEDKQHVRSDFSSISY